MVGGGEVCVCVCVCVRWRVAGAGVRPQKILGTKIFFSDFSRARAGLQHARAGLQHLIAIQI